MRELRRVASDNGPVWAGRDEEDVGKLLGDGVEGEAVEDEVVTVVEMGGITGEGEYGGGGQSGVELE